MTRTLRAYGVFIGTLGILLAWLVTTLLLSLAPNALTSRTAVGTAARDLVAAVAPQRWEFFTASLQKSALTAYSSTSSSSLLDLPQTRARNIFGMSRTQRAQGPEIALISADVKWVKCSNRSQPETCVKQAQREVQQVVANAAAHRTLCGPMVLAEVKPTPFEFREFGYESTYIVRTASVSVRCN
ncbi:SdpA family antimicrobial peptide system protein [Curtobacterium flaccumfaciens pv. flaccumfaciens]|uniref:SdpA family antimicrobial peptide system protein n=1 Tax=Curtobacterium flaccumfaciens TaxID=2035 RepID=UPI00265A8B04|nr:SdpA family antimicrobial peptide system protein [Curtobacterium flaccumfaciens]MCS5508683.1 SdpA family antimicrobial peptide system protein [Curtobacterium flaccumfaciens pv. flaccumfaciens]